MVYREQWISEILQGRSILTLALDIHMATTGSMERSHDESAKDAGAAQGILVSWDDSNECEFDRIVKSLLQEAVIEYHASRIF